MSLSEQIDRLAAYEPAAHPVVSLYLNTQPGPVGRDQHHAFIRKEFKARSGTYPANSPERESLEKDLERIGRYLDMELQPSANGVAIFACSASDLFEPVQLTAPIEQHWLYIGDQPHLYPLARLESQHPRYAAVVADTNTARILVFAAAELVAEREVNGVKTRRNSQGGWSQARFQRHIGEFHQQHAKEVVEVLEQIVQKEGINEVVIAGDDVITPLLRAEMPKSLADKVIDHVKLDMRAASGDVLKTSIDAMQKMNERTDREKVDSAVGQYRAGGLGVVGPEETLAALLKGQVEELLVTASMAQLRAIPNGNDASATANDAVLTEPAVEAVSAGGEAPGAAPEVVRLADELVTKARQTGARITFIEDGSLLGPHGGAAGLLRYRI